jgi:hypothetical protein
VLFFRKNPSNLKRSIPLLLKLKTRPRHNNKTKKRMRKLAILKMNTRLYYMGKGFFVDTSKVHKYLKKNLKKRAVKMKTNMHKYT